MRQGYFYLQAAAGFLWWLGITTSSATRAFFGMDERDVRQLFVPDLALYVGGSLAVAWAATNRPRWYRPLLLTHLGAVLYATLYCLSLNGHVALMFMLPSLAVVLYFAVRS